MTYSEILSVAPMLDCTDRHFRYLMRLITRHTVLYTEMLTTHAILHGNTSQLLARHPLESPVVVQFGGSSPADLAQSTIFAAQVGFDEVNLNVGCPSDRVCSGSMGASLMLRPEQVALCVKAMHEATHLPVTVKCRLGVDEVDSYDYLHHFISTVAKDGCKKFIIHARKAWLKGLSPKQNRTVPPLDYDRVYRLKKDFPELCVIINGGITSLNEAVNHIQNVDGVMIGRAAYSNPFMLEGVDAAFYGNTPKSISEEDVVSQYLDYVRGELGAGVKLSILTRPLLGLFQGKPGARNWRRHLSCHSHQKGAGSEVIQEAFESYRREQG